MIRTRIGDLVSRCRCALFRNFGLVILV